MGSFFTNVQVHTGEAPAQEARAAAVEAVRGWVARTGYEEMAEEDADVADRLVLVAPADQTPWIAVYDEATEDQDTRLLDSLAEALSAGGRAAVSVLVHDSDVLQLRLCQDGRLADVFNSRPDYFDELSDEERARVAGQPERWRPVLADGATPDDLRLAWMQPAVRVEEVLSQVARLLGMDPRRCAIGSHGLRRGEGDTDGFSRLAFRSTAIPHPLERLRSDGPPRLRAVGGQQRRTVPVGAPFRDLAATAQSVGGPSRGLYVAVWGEAVVDGLVWPTTIHLVRRDERGRVAEDRVALLSPSTADGTAYWHVTLEDFEIPRGFPEGSELLLGAGVPPRRLMAAQTAAWLSVVVAGEALQAGEGQVHLGFVPLEDPDNGGDTWTARVTVTSS